MCTTFDKTNLFCDKWFGFCFNDLYSGAPYAAAMHQGHGQLHTVYREFFAWV